jgi:hypothetical protein
MNEPSRIRGSFTIRWSPTACQGLGGYLVSIPNYEGGEVVPVPDEQAIERGAIALFALAGWPPRMAHYAQKAWPNVSESLRVRHRAHARAVLAAALEQPE